MKTPHDLVLEYLSHCKVSPRDLEIFLCYLGMPGYMQNTFDFVSKKYNLSKEGVRVVHGKVAKVVSRYRSVKEVDYTASLLMKDLLSEMSRKSRLISDMEHDLLARGLIADGEGMHSVFRSLAFLRIQHEFKFVKWGDSFAVVKSEKPACWLAMMSHVKKMAKTSGAINTQNISEILACDGIFVDSAYVRDMLSPFMEAFKPEINETATQGDYFFFRDRINNVCLKAKRLLSVVVDISAENLMVSKRIGSNKYNIKVPNSLIERMLSCNGFDVESGVVRIGTVEPAESIGEKRELLVDIVKKMGGSPIKDDFIDQCLLAGVNKNTVNSYIGSSGLFVTDDNRIYLVGPRPSSRSFRS